MKPLAACLFAACLCVTAPGRAAPTDEAVKPPAESLPALTADQYRADFDQAIGFIDAFAVHKDLNARRLAIDYPQRFDALRRRIDDRMDTCAFSRLLGTALHLVQDLHAGTMPHAYLQQYGNFQSRYNIPDDDSYAAVGRIEQACPTTPPQLDLPLAYIDGQYVVYADFDYHGTPVGRGTRLTTYNGQDIASYVREHPDTVWPLRMTPDGRHYSLRFYRDGEARFRLGLSDGRELAMDTGDTIDWKVPRTHAISFSSQSEARVLYFPGQRTLYIGIPAMDETLVEGINAQVDAVVRKGGKIDRIAIDIRGNGGGSDLTWRRVLSHLVGREMRFTLDLRMKDTPLARARYPQDPAPVAHPVALLGGARYWTHNANTIAFGPDADSLRFTGPIYVLRDAYIYSSAANLANFANTDPQLVSVGETTDLVGGAQIEPLFFRLDHTGLVFRLEPALDFSGVQTLDDFAHNHVEVAIAPSVEDLFLRSTYPGDIYGETFLLRHDPLLRYVLSQ